MLDVQQENVLAVLGFTHSVTVLWCGWVSGLSQIKRTGPFENHTFWTHQLSQPIFICALFNVIRCCPRLVLIDSCSDLRAQKQPVSIRSLFAMKSLSTRPDELRLQRPRKLGIHDIPFFYYLRVNWFQSWSALRCWPQNPQSLAGWLSQRWLLRANLRAGENIGSFAGHVLGSPV